MTTSSRMTTWGKPALAVLLSAGLMAPVAGSAQAARYEAPVDPTARYEVPADVLARYEATGEIDLDDLVTGDGETVSAQEFPIAIIIKLIVAAMDLIGEWGDIVKGCSGGKSECEAALGASKAVQELLNMVVGFLPGISAGQLTEWLAELISLISGGGMAVAGE